MTRFSTETSTQAIRLANPDTGRVDDLVLIRCVREVTETLEIVMREPDDGELE